MKTKQVGETPKASPDTESLIETLTSGGVDSDRAEVIAPHIAELINKFPTALHHDTRDFYGVPEATTRMLDQ